MITTEQQRVRRQHGNQRLLSIYVPADLMERVIVEAGLTERTISAVVREAIDRNCGERKGAGQ